MKGFGSSKGFTVVELIFVIAIVGILFSLTVWNTFEWMHKIKVRNFAERVLSELEQARSLACRYGNYTFPFQEIYERVNQTESIEIELSSKLLSGKGLVFRRNGLPNKNGHILIKDKEGRIKYLICINHLSGRIRLIEAENSDDCKKTRK